jgi:hypothetical protein
MNSTAAPSMAARSSALLCLLLAVAGCASMSENACRSADWYQLGYRDGDIYGLRPQIDQYAYQCRPWVQVAETDYMRGWTEGYRENRIRASGSECCASR